MILQKDLVIQLFPHCNLNCDFCYLDRKTKRSKLEYIDLCIQSIKNNKLKSDSVEMWGGEIFYDNSSIYLKKMIELIELLNPKFLTIHTNLVFNIESSLLLSYLEEREINLTLYTSYDPEGRFKNQAMLDLFLSNVRKITNKLFFFSNGTLEVSTVLTERLLNNQCDLSVLDSLYSNESIRLVFYLDYNGYKDVNLRNSSSCILDFLARYPKCQNVLVLGENRNSPNKWCLCNNAVQLCYESDFEPQKNGQCMTTEDFTEIKKLWEAKHDCNNCEFNSYCKDVCIGAIVKSGIINQPVCYRKLMYKKFYPIRAINV